MSTRSDVHRSSIDRRSADGFDANGAGSNGRTIDSKPSREADSSHGRTARRNESRSPRRFARLSQIRIASLSPTPTLLPQRERSRSTMSRRPREESREGRSGQIQVRPAALNGMANGEPNSPAADRQPSSDVDLEKAGRGRGVTRKAKGRTEAEFVAAVFPHPISHFLGYRRPVHHLPERHRHVKPFASIMPAVHRLPLVLESLIWMFIGAFVGIAIVQLVFTRPRHFTSSDDVPPHAWASPVIIGSFGASSVLLYGAPLSPLSQPRPFVGGQLISALAGVSVTKLIKLAGPTWYDLSDTDTSHSLVWVAGALAAGLSLLLMSATGTFHPPGGATAVLCATNQQVERLSWRVLPVVLLSSVLMVSWNLVWLNLGRRRYPTSFIAGAPATADEGNFCAYIYDLIKMRRERGNAKRDSDKQRGEDEPEGQSAHSQSNPSKPRDNAVWQDVGGWGQRSSNNGKDLAGDANQGDKNIGGDEDEEDGAFRTPMERPTRWPSSDRLPTQSGT